VLPHRYLGAEVLYISDYTVKLSVNNSEGTVSRFVRIIMVKGKVTSKSTKKAPSNVPRPSSVSPAIAVGKSKLCGGASIPTCCSCGEHVTDEVKALQCDKCQKKESWKCADCLNLSNNVYDALVAEKGPPLRWFCEECDEAWRKPGFGSSDSGYASAAVR